MIAFAHGVNLLISNQNQPKEQTHESLRFLKGSSNHLVADRGKIINLSFGANEIALHWGWATIYGRRYFLLRSKNTTSRLPAFEASLEEIWNTLIMLVIFLYQHVFDIFLFLVGNLSEFHFLFISNLSSVTCAEIQQCDKFLLKNVGDAFTYEW